MHSAHQPFINAGATSVKLWPPTKQRQSEKVSWGSLTFYIFTALSPGASSAQPQRVAEGAGPADAGKEAGRGGELPLRCSRPTATPPAALTPPISRHVSSLACGTDTGKQPSEPGRPEWASQLHVVALGPGSVSHQQKGATAPPRAMLSGLRREVRPRTGMRMRPRLLPAAPLSLVGLDEPQQPRPPPSGASRALPSSCCPRGLPPIRTPLPAPSTPLGGAVRVMFSHEHCSQELVLLPLGAFGAGGATELVSQSVVRVTCPSGQEL